MKRIDYISGVPRPPLPVFHGWQVGQRLRRGEGDKFVLWELVMSHGEWYLNAVDEEENGDPERYFILPDDFPKAFYAVNE